MNVAYVVLSIDGVTYMFFMQFYVHMVLCASFTYDAMYMVLCAGGVVYMWCHVHVMHVVMCMSNIVHTLYRWYYVHVALSTRLVCGVVCM